MEKKIYYLNPVFEAKYWGGQALRGRYGYDPDIPNIAIAYHVIALPGHRDDLVAELFAQKISLAFRCHAAASAGIHIDNASKGDIQILIKSSEKCCEELIKKMKQHSSPTDALIHA